MMKTRLIIFLVAVCFIPFVACRTAGPLQPTQLSRINPAGPYVHSASGMTFPEHIGAFQRVEIIRYDSTGNDVSAGYNLANQTHKVFMTVYIYPRPKMTSISVFPPLVTKKSIPGIDSNHFEGIKTQIEKTYPGSKLVNEDIVFLTQGGKRYQGQKATYESDSLPAFVNQEALSDAYLFPYGNWFIAYRISYLKVSHEAVNTDIEQFLQLLKWP